MKIYSFLKKNNKEKNYNETFCNIDQTYGAGLMTF